MNQRLTLRPEVEAFAQAMERKLLANDHKGGWRCDDPHALLDRLHDEAAELDNIRHLMHACVIRRAEYPVGQGDPSIHAARVLDEAADVANFAMMIADVCGALRTETK